MNVPETVYHVPVMLNQSVDGLSVRKGGVYVDVTFGGGGHSREILRRMDSDGRLFGFDQDGDAAANVPQDGCLPTWECRATISTTWSAVFLSGMTPSLTCV